MIVIDKSQDWTSHDVVAKLRGLLHERRIGHAGTLDPMATGVLPVFVGRATRAVEYAAEGEKEYLAGLRLGTVTNTQDTTGTVLSTKQVCISQDTLIGALPHFTGPTHQIPPMYSAIKMQGKKLYELARKGIEVERKPRPIVIHALTLEAQQSETDFLLRVRCSKGTYVRTLCHDIGTYLGCGGTMFFLQRTMAAGFTLEDCISLEQLSALSQEARNRALLPTDRCFLQYPALTCTEEEERRFIRNGTPYPCQAPEARYRVYGADGHFLMLGQVSNGKMVTEKSFFQVMT